LPPPSKEWERDPSDKTDATNQARVSFVGSPPTITGQIEEFVRATSADELIAVAHIYDHAARLRSYELAAACLAEPRHATEPASPKRGSA
jgi:alkanesulfonate monooxygenase SsuD/methylene tetrahydromethanopterin reductase-like flavin-dependent oxidoreductase (luciferase family)